MSVSGSPSAGEHVVDLLVVGSGNGGLTAALCAYELGVEDVLVVEKSDKFGGTSATSGGAVWIPCNRHGSEAGVEDSAEEALEFLKRSIPETVPRNLLETYVREAPKLIAFLEERTRVRYLPVKYYRELTGGEKIGDVVRSLEPEPVHRNVLGAERDHVRETHRVHWLFDRIAITHVETLTMLLRMPGWRRTLARVLWRHFSDLPWVLTHRRSRRLACGPAGIARLRWSMLDRGIPLWLNARLKELRTDNRGRVVGAIVARGGEDLTVHARRGVVLAAGGFESNQAMRERYLPKPTSYEWSAAVGTNTGDAILAALEIGAATRLMEGAFWTSTYHVPDNPVAWLANVDKTYAGNCVVNRRGVRIANESLDYTSFQLEVFRKHTDSDPQVPMWMVFDWRFRRRHFVGPLSYGHVKPDWRLPKLYFSSGFLTKAKTIRGLALEAGIDPEGLERTVAAMNEYARTGTDLEFGRGTSEHEMHFPDPDTTGTPGLAPIAEPPFYAIRMEPGDFGTHGGLVTDADARVLNVTGEPIPGLYAVGLTAAAMAPTYPAPGLSLGPAMVFGCQAARHIALDS